MRGLIATLLLAATLTSAAVWAQTAPAANAVVAHYTTQDTDLGTLLDDRADIDTAFAKLPAKK